jgi:hypothetical protein
MKLFWRLFVVTGLVCAIGVGPASADIAPMPNGAPPPKPIPSNYVQVSPCIPTMGAHYADPKAASSSSPLYGVYQNKPVFTEIMVTPKEFAAGKSWINVLQPLPGYQINHVDIGFMPHGHPGMLFPHYDIHAYYVSHADHMGFCGGEAAMKKMSETHQ